MKQQLITTVKEFPTEEAKLAAYFRQLVRNRDAEDQVAVWLTANTICSYLCLLLENLLVGESLWNSQDRWIDVIFRRTIILDLPTKARVAGPVTWGRNDNPGGPQWAEPFEAELEFSPGLLELVGYTIRFGNKRAMTGEALAQIERLHQDIEKGSVVWAFHFNGP